MFPQLELACFSSRGCGAAQWWDSCLDSQMRTDVPGIRAVRVSVAVSLSVSLSRVPASALAFMVTSSRFCAPVCVHACVFNPYPGRPVATPGQPRGVTMTPLCAHDASR